MDVIQRLREQVSRDREMVKARDVMIDILEDALQRWRVAGFSPKLELGACDALVTLRLDTSVWALQQVGLPLVADDQHAAGGVVKRVEPPSLVGERSVNAAVASSAFDFSFVGGGGGGGGCGQGLYVTESGTVALQKWEPPSWLVVKFGSPETEPECGPSSPAAESSTDAADGVSDLGQLEGPPPIAAPLSDAVGMTAVPASNPDVRIKQGAWTPARDADLLRLRAEGLTYVQIAAELGVTKQSVSIRLCRLRKNGHAVVPEVIAVTPPVWTPERDIELLELLETGVTAAEAAERLGVTRAAVDSRRNALRGQGRDVPALTRAESIIRAQEACEVWTPDLDARLAELYRRGQSDIDIARDLDLTPGAVGQRLSVLRNAGKLEHLSRRAIRASIWAADVGKVARPAVTEQKSEQRSAVNKQPLPDAAVADRAPAGQSPAVALSQTEKIIAQHVEDLPKSSVFDAGLDLELCEAVFGGKGGIDLFAVNMGLDHREALTRFEQIVAPFRRAGEKRLPIETGGLILPALRARAAKARGAAA